MSRFFICLLSVAFATVILPHVVFAESALQAIENEAVQIEQSIENDIEDAVEDFEITNPYEEENESRDGSHGVGHNLELDNHAESYETAHNDNHSGDDQHPESSGGLPQLNFETFPGQIFWLLLTFFTLHFLMSKKYLPAVGVILEERREHIQNHLDDADQFKSDAQEAQEKYDALMKGAYEHSSDLMQKTNQDIKNKTEALLADFRERQAVTLADTEADTVKMKNDIMKNVEGIAAGVAVESAHKISGIQSTEKKIEAFIQKLSKSTDKKAA